jgi:methionyl aminopeptidase
MGAIVCLLLRDGITGEPDVMEVELAGRVILSPKEIKEMRVACQLAAETLVLVGKMIRPGLTTEEINTFVHEHTLKQGGIPAPLNYRGFPKSVCTSVNEVVCHGIPEDRELLDGDIINVDVTTIYPQKKGFFGDTSATFFVGTPSPSARLVTEVARTCLTLGIEQVRPGARLGDIGHAIQSYAESKGCSVVRDYTGHGIGRIFHGPPSVCHIGRAGTGDRLKRGQTFTIEPMINLGSYQVDLMSDEWTVLTRDRALSAQFEHTLVVTRSGCEVLTRRSAPLANSEEDVV